MWTVNELFYGPEPVLTHIYEYSRINPLQVGVEKEQINHVKQKKGKLDGHHDVHLKVDMCWEAYVRKVRRVLIELPGVTSLGVSVATRKVTVLGNVKPEMCLMAMAKIRKRAALWGDAETGGGKEGKRKKKKSADGN